MTRMRVVGSLVAVIVLWMTPVVGTRISGQGAPAAQRPAPDVSAANLTGKIVTVNGPIDPGGLGTTLMHEHVFIDVNDPGNTPERWRWSDRGSRMGATALSIYDRPLTMEILSLVRQGYPNRDNLLLADEATAVQELLEYKAWGGTSLVDTTSIGLRRDPVALKRIAKATGLNIVMGASWYRKTYHPPDMDSRSLDSLSDEIVRDVTLGVGDTGIHAGIIGEVGIVAGYMPQEPDPRRVDLRDPLTANEVKVIRASGRAGRLTGAAVSLHIYKEHDRVLDLLASEGIDLNRVILGHSDPLAHDVPLMLKLLSRGVYIQFDMLGMGPRLGSGRLADETVGKGIMELAKAGYLNRILLSQDVCTKVQLKAYGGTGYSYLHEQFLPYLRQLGATEAQVETMMVANPKRVLTFVAPMPTRVTD